MVRVSVVLPFYGSHQSGKSLQAITEAWLRQSVHCEVVIAVNGSQDLSVAPNIDADRSVRVVRTDLRHPAPGILRNVGVTHARRDWLYLADADIAPVGDDFLARAHDMSGGLAVAQPWMYRIGGGGERASAPFRIREEPAEPFCYGYLDPRGTVMPTGGEKLIWRVMEDGGDRLHIPVVKNMDLTDDNREMKPAFHWGGLFISKGDFIGVGGYCERYIGWGGEDDDLLAKIRSTEPVRRAWDLDPGLACIHFEHPHLYSGGREHLRNRKLLRMRRAMGAEAMIRADRVQWEDSWPS